MSGIRWLSGPLLVTAALGIAGVAHAQPRATQTTTFLVQITIQGTCQIGTADNINFGIRPATPGAVHTQTGSITLQCTKDLPYTLGLDGGHTGDTDAREMQHTTNTGAFIPYTLWHDAAHQDAWGNDDTSWYSGTGQGLDQTQSLAVYARTVLTGAEPVGAYSDTVTATLTY